VSHVPYHSPYNADSPKPGDYDHFEFSRHDEIAGKRRGQAKLTFYRWTVKKELTK